MTRRLEVLLRMAIVFLMLVSFAASMSTTISWYWTRAHGVGLHHLPYRDFLWEFPPLTTVVMPLVWLSFGSVTRFAGLVRAGDGGRGVQLAGVLRRAFADRAQESSLLDGAHGAARRPLLLPARLPVGAPGVCGMSCSCARPQRRGRVVAGVAAKLWAGLLIAPLVAQRRGVRSV